MILNNTQANIFKVNGGIADNFANRPAASGSFYIFYSIDTQEIYYDNGAWILLGSGGGGGVNIYNSDGTLTGNRTLNGANNDLNFADLNIFKTSIGGNDIGLKLDFANNFFGIGNNLQDIFFYIENNYKTIVSQYNGNVEGLKLDFIQRTYELGNLDYNFNRTIFIIDDNNEYIKTKNQGNDIGLKLDFANSAYQFGQITGGGETTININDTAQTINTKQYYFPTSTPNVINGIDLNLQSEIYKFGAINGSYANHHLISDSQNYWFYTRLFGANRGLFFQVSNLARLYLYGELSSNNLTSIIIDDIAQSINLINTNNSGLSLDFFNQTYLFGQITSGNSSHIVIEDANEQIRTNFGTNTNGLSIDMASNYFQFGRIVGGNNTFFAINDGGAYPLEINGTNVLSGTSGGNSGQHLKIKVNGVDYKIELKNP